MAMIRKIKRRARKYRMINQPRYPGLFSTLDFSVAAVQMVVVVAVFGSILQYALQ